MKINQQKQKKQKKNWQGGGEADQIYNIVSSAPMKSGFQSRKRVGLGKQIERQIKVKKKIEAMNRKYSLI